MAQFKFLFPARNEPLLSRGAKWSRVRALDVINRCIKLCIESCQFRACEAHASACAQIQAAPGGIWCKADCGPATFAAPSQNVLGAHSIPPRPGLGDDRSPTPVSAPSTDLYHPLRGSKSPRPWYWGAGARQTARDNALASCVCAGCCGCLELRARRRRPDRRAVFCPRPQVRRRGLYQRPEPARGVGVRMPATWLDAAQPGSCCEAACSAGSQLHTIEAR